MCGIVGYIGENDAKGILLNGLEKLEYRGYDSAGIAVQSTNDLKLFKVKGRIATLREAVDENTEATVGIGHTRWATHGQPNETNAHPHMSQSGRYTLVHNGVIENYHELKNEYLTDVEFVSETDTEVIVQLVDQFAKETGSTMNAFRKTIDLLEGSYAIALLDQQDEETIFVAKNKSPLLVGRGEGFNVVSSDSMAMLQVTDRFVELMDEEIVLVQKDQVTIQQLDGTEVARESFEVDMNIDDIEKGTYPHFMLKEIDEQPFVMRKIIQEYQNESDQIKLDEGVRDAMKDCDRVYIIAAGTSYHAGLIGKELLETVAEVPTEVHIASEFSYNMPLLSKKPLFIFISQSGETADLRAVLVEIKKMGHPSITITNVPGSTLSREATHTLHLHAGPEIAVASTKAYTAQLAVLTILAVDTAQAKDLELDFDPLKELAIVGNAMEALCDQKDRFEKIAYQYLYTTRNCFFIGRGMDYHVALEGALKLKEISYIQAEGFAGGELKHGTIALIEEGTPVIALSTQEHVNNLIRSNVQEVEARGANVCMVTREGLERPEDDVIIQDVHPLLAPLVSVLPLQLMAYYAALHRDCDVDKPRNLAKSVTVE
ncbi:MULTISPECIES: glutamine--fructose-6-phosphate transaminase (isomerizing) [Allobacillus]|uniref:Glutamine--fructose-6-phosphate aminotransferase [isomerizing] n=1 Tax=Allobacillus salarius TaxID=1955272 RepID=A0A556PKL8_9BACI|nr:glutamine--fructose-6-phosphate transaminase (isomerizing) [Allobacillus salarius]TSJ64941.1 glutamine--fructose-6-phosphate transaminase (isomerizing) [Allobacillus salarius]